MIKLQPTLRSPFELFEPASSEAGRDVHRQVEEVITDSVRLRQHENLAELMAALLDAFEPNWGGYGESRVQVESAEAALHFVERFPSGFPPPWASVHPDGTVSLGWRFKRGRMLSIAFEPGGTLAYAIRSPEQSEAGRLVQREPVPEKVLRDLRALMAESASG